MCPRIRPVTSYPPAARRVTGYSYDSKKIRGRPSSESVALDLRPKNAVRPLNQPLQPAGGCGPEPGGGGSRGRVRLVAIKIPIPSRTMMPTTIQFVGTLRRYAAIASPTMRTMKPMRYVANEDIEGDGRARVQAWLQVMATTRVHTGASLPVGFIATGNHSTATTSQYLTERPAAHAVAAASPFRAAARRSSPHDRSEPRRRCEHPESWIPCHQSRIGPDTFHPRKARYIAIAEKAFGQRQRFPAARNDHAALFRSDSTPSREREPALPA